MFKTLTPTKPNQLNFQENVAVFLIWRQKDMYRTENIISLWKKLDGTSY